MILIQILLILGVSAALIYVLSNRKSKSIRAYKRLGMIFLALAMIVAVVFPELSNDIAHFLGVGRGADLLIYIVTMSFILFVLNDFLYRQDQRDLTTRLARMHALAESRQRYKSKLKS